MPLSDNNPERRNLLISSLGFVVFFAGEGKLIDEQLRIQVISISFENTVVIAVFAWIMLFWFFLRYKQTCSGELNKAIFQEVKSEIQNKVLIWYLQKTTKKPYRDEDGFVVHEIVPRQKRWTAQIALVQGGKRSDEGVWVEFKKIQSETFNINSAWFGIVKLSLLLSLSIRKPGIGSWFVPIALFYLACFLGVLNFVFR